MEVHTEEGVSLRVSERPRGETHLPESFAPEDVLRLWFPTRRAAAVYAAVRARDLWREGTEVVDMPLVLQKDLLDNRFPHEHGRYSSDPDLLKW